MIAYNGQPGICIPNTSVVPNNQGDPGVSIEIRSNSIFANRGLPVDLGEPGLNVNDYKNKDGDVKPFPANKLINHAELTAVIPSAAATSSANALNTAVTVQGIYKGKSLTHYRLEFFQGCGCAGGNEICNIDRNQPPLHFVEVNTDDEGIASFTTVLTLNLNLGQSFISCSATDPENNSSEYSPCIAVDGRSPTFIPAIAKIGFDGKNIIVEGENFDSATALFIDDVEMKTRNDQERPKNRLISPKAGKKVKAGREVILYTKNGDSTRSERFSYTRE
ncbi:MAG TPA: hypothetical protein VJ464_25795 [Blastocatellia bacterium]|nr:hypothetical protein [Blastocatellia bacterium]